MKEEKASRWCVAVAVVAGERILLLLLLLLLLLRDGGEELQCRKSETRTSQLEGIRCRGRRGSVRRRVRRSSR